jgi:hypothetical protein
MQMQRFFTHWSAAFVLAVLIGSATGVIAAKKPTEWNPTIDPADFTTNVTNQYFPLDPGTTCNYATPDGSETMTFEVTRRTKTVMGVTTVVVIETHHEDGQLVEVSENWFAQDSDGNVWYFGEFSQTYENGVPTTTEGSWEAGVNGALPGIIMQADPQHGQTYFQEFAPDVATDMAMVLTTSDIVTVPAGTYTNVLRTKEWTPLETATVEHKYYAPNVGLIQEQDGSSLLQLISCN